MLKFFLPLLALGCLAPSTQLHAATGGPDDHGYTWADSNFSVPFEWITVGTFSATTVLSGNAVNAGNVELDVPWGGIYGVPVSEIRISRNGYITDLLTASGNDETNDCPLPADPSVGAGGWRIYPLHDDLELHGTTGRVLYQYYAESPHPLHDCGVHVITWKNVYHEGQPDTETFSFQVLLFDNLDILFQYGSGNQENGIGSTTGIQNFDPNAAPPVSNIGLSIFCDEKEIPDDFAILIQPPTLTVNTVADEFDTPAGSALSLREAIRDIPDGGRVVILPTLDNQTSDLSAAGGGQGSQIVLNGKTVAVDGSGLSGKFHLSGGDAEPHFTVLNSSWLGLSGIYLERASGRSVRVTSSSGLVAYDTCWVANQDTTNSGAAIMLEPGCGAGLTRCELIGNRSQLNGGAINASSATLRAEKCRFWNNHATGALARGGAISTVNTDLTLRFCDIAMNICGGNGGGLSIDSGVEANLFGCTFDNNRAVDGGGIALINSGASPSVADLRFCTFFENCASDNGGAIFESGFGANLTLNVQNSTLYKNFAANAGGAFHLSVATTHPTVQAIVMADNTSDQIAGAGSLNVQPDNLETGNEGNFAGSGGQSNITDMGLTNLGHFGGFVRVCMPLQHFPGIDSAAGTASNILGDARGFPSPRDGGTPGFPAEDCGAVELGETTLVTSSGASGSGSLDTALAAVQDGGVIALQVAEIADQPSSGLMIPTGKTVFIDASPAGGTTIHNLAADLNSGQNLAMHAITATANSQAQGITVGSGQFTAHECEFLGFTLAEDRGLLDLGGPASLLGSSFCGASFRNEFFIQSTSNLVARDCHWDAIAAGRRSSRRILALNSSTACVQRCSFYHNSVYQTSSSGGIVYAFTDLDVRPRNWLLIENSTISGNTVLNGFGSASCGGLIVLPKSFGSLNQHRCYVEAHHNTIFQNRFYSASSTALAIHESGVGHTNARLSGNILAENTDNESIFPGTTTSEGGNLSDTTPAFFTGSDIPSTDPELGPPVSGSDHTLVHVPRPGSPCIDGRSTDFSPAHGCTDARGFRRYFDGDGNGSTLIDIGAVESGRVLQVTTGSDENNTGLGLGSGDSLRECIAQVDNFGSVNIHFASALNNTTLIHPSSINPDSGIIDVHGMSSGITLQRSSTIFGLSGDARIAVCDLLLEGTTASVGTENSRTCFSACRGDNLATWCNLRDAAFATLIDCNISATNTSSSSFAEDNSRLYIDGCTFHKSFTPVSTRDNGHAVIKHSTLTGSTGRIWTGSGNSRAYFLACTATRNGRGFSPTGTAEVYLHRCIVGNNTETLRLPIQPERYRSLGGNLFGFAPHLITGQSDDLFNRSVYLAPLADYDGDGLDEMPLLSASTTFASHTGAHLPPGDVIIVNTNADQDDSPAGAQISLREAMRDIETGGTIIFDPAMSNLTFDAIGAPGFILNKSLTLDATSLPHGIDLTARLAWGDGHHIALHGVDISDVFTSLDGGAIRCVGSGGSFIASHCSFHNNSAISGGGIYIQNGDLVLENCTFSQNIARDAAGGGAVRALSTDGSIEFCTFGENSGPIAAIVGNANADLSLYANVFFSSTASLGPVASITSDGYNVFQDSPAGLGAGTNDHVGVSNLNIAHSTFEDSLDAWTKTYYTLPLFSPPQDITPSVTSGVIPPPEHDARGFDRIFGSAADAGSLEFAGGFLDTDGDGLMDWWEKQHGLDRFTANDPCDDSDNDGTSLIDEFLWRTDPNDPTSFQAITLSPDGTFGFNSIPGYTYSIYTSENMNTWTLQGSAQADTAPLTFSFDMSKDRHFIRVERK